MRKEPGDQKYLLESRSKCGKSHKKFWFVWCAHIDNLQFDSSSCSMFHQVLFIWQFQGIFSFVVQSFVSDCEVCEWIELKNRKIHQKLFTYFNRYPFDVHSPIGFTIGYIIQILTGYHAVFMFAIQMYVTGGFIWFASAFTSDVKKCLDRLNIEIEAIRNGEPTIKQRICINQIISDIIQFHSVAKQFSDNFK